MRRESNLHAALLCAVLLAAQGAIVNGVRPTLLTVAQPSTNVSVPKQNVLQPPIAEQRPFKWIMNGEDDDRVDVREDPYGWLRDDKRKDPDVLEYLEAENEYTEAIMSDTKQLQKGIFDEIWGRIQEEDEAVPQRIGNYFYYGRTVEGEQYRVRCRRKIPEGMGAPSELDAMDESIPEEILLDENAEAKSHSYFKTTGFQVSLDEKLIMYAVDTSGDEEFTMHVKEISTGKEVLKSPIEGMSTMVFAPDSKTIFYTTVGRSHLANKVWRHKLGTSPKKDKLVFHEQDETFFVSNVWRSSDDKYIFFKTRTWTSSEMHYLNASNPDGEWKVLSERQPYKSYTANHREGYFYMRISENHRPNEEVVVAPVSDPKNQTVLVPHRKDMNIMGLVLSKNFMTVLRTKEGLRTATVYQLPKNGSAPQYLDDGEDLQFNETSYKIELSGHDDVEADMLRVVYTSLKTPATVIDYNLATGKSAIKKVSVVLGGFNSSDYQTERLWATANDSTKVPISLVYKKDAVKLDGSDPLLLTAYGAFGMSSHAEFLYINLPLLDRGFVYAIAHVRGGGEVGGRYWHAAGKLLNKKNTFTDIVACAEELVAQNYSSPRKMSLYGASAGGLAVAATVNMRPDLFRAAIALVPVVDVVTSWIDDSLTLTINHWQEFGSPLWGWEYYDYIKSWSPYDNIEAEDYPDMLLTSGLNDPRVPYWEAAKFTAKLRATKTDDNLLLFKCDMESGHFSKSGRFDQAREIAFRYAFLFKSLGMTKSPEEA